MLVSRGLRLQFFFFDAGLSWAELEASTERGSSGDDRRADLIFCFFRSPVCTVYAIEATVHAPTSEDIYSEIFKVLKPGGVCEIYEWVMVSRRVPRSNSFSRRISLSPFYGAQTNILLDFFTDRQVGPPKP